jgi:hypothetical protein
MGSNPIMLALAFFLELAGLASIGVWGWHAGTGWTRFLLAISVPLAAAAVWGIFRVPNDPGAALVQIPGWLRLTLELTYFSFAVWGLFNSGLTTLGWILGVVTFLHYAASYDHVLWLIKQ